MAIMELPARIKRQVIRISIGLCFIGLLSQVLTAPKGDEENISPGGSDSVQTTGYQNITSSNGESEEINLRTEAEDKLSYVENTGYLNINACSEKELQSLPGIGKILAQRIIRFRSEYGFKRKEDLMFIQGIGPGKYDNLKMLVTVK
jgi:competence ComEA-like helix-hairpin-helix protein